MNNESHSFEATNTDPAPVIEFVETPRHITSPEKIDRLLEKRMRKFLMSRQQPERLGKDT